MPQAAPYIVNRFKDGLADIRHHLAEASRFFDEGEYEGAIFHLERAEDAVRDTRSYANSSAGHGFTSERRYR